MSTVGYELAANRSIAAATDPDAFTAYILEGQPEPPLYFARMKRDNRDGPALLGEVPEPRLIPATKLGDLAGATGVAVLDTRSWDEYRHAHLPGALFTPLNSQFNTIAGCYVPEKMPIVLIVDEKRVREAIVDLIHVGLDHVIGYATPEMFTAYAAKGKPAAIAQIEPDEMEKSVASGAFLLDVRRSAEILESGRMASSYNIAHTRLLERIAEVPRTQPIVVHCSSGSRSRYAAGLLDRLGYRVTNVAGGLMPGRKRAEPSSWPDDRTCPRRRVHAVSRLWRRRGGERTGRHVVAQSPRRVPRGSPGARRRHRRRWPAHQVHHRRIPGASRRLYEHPS